MMQFDIGRRENEIGILIENIHSIQTREFREIKWGRWFMEKEKI